jgi:mono/diheme cytochrome c family protein
MPLRFDINASAALHAPVLRQLVFLGLLSISSAAFALSIELPPDTTALRTSALPGYLLAQQNCVTCHSAQYPSSQPPGLPHSFWEAEVKKMKATYGAQFPDQDIPAIADYLTKAYGAEAPK